MPTARRCIILATMGNLDLFRKRDSDEDQNDSGSEILGSPQPEESERRQVGDKMWDCYEIHDIRGGPSKSGMGIVYLCYHNESGEPVAIKTLQDKFLHDRNILERFKWEAEAWVNLEKHHNIVQAKYVTTQWEFPYGECIDRPYIFLEYVVGDEEYGPDLSGWISVGGLDIPLVLNFAIQFCHGMIHADNRFKDTGKPFVHRDIKPSNIMVTRDRVVKITDFGLVKAFGESTDDRIFMIPGSGSNQRLGLSKVGSICGTPPYMSPEQYFGETDIDRRSDIYSFGCVLYEMVTGKPPFEAYAMSDYVHLHVKVTPKTPDTHEELGKVIMKCLKKDPNERYQDFKELEKSLAEIYFSITGEIVKQPEAKELEAWELGNKARSLMELERWDEAIGSFHQALKTDATFNLARWGLAEVYEVVDRYDEAIKEYLELIRLNPSNVSYAHFRLGVLYSDFLGRLDDAIREFRESSIADPNDSAAHDRLGMAYADAGRLDEAMIEYEEALRLYPDDECNQEALGRLYYRLGGRLSQTMQELITAWDFSLRKRGESEKREVATRRLSDWLLLSLGIPLLGRLCNILLDLREL